MDDGASLVRLLHNVINDAQDGSKSNVRDTENSKACEIYIQMHDCIAY